MKIENQSYTYSNPTTDDIETTTFLPDRVTEDELRSPETSHFSP